MRATAIEFRLRMLINLIIILLGFWAPWIEGWGIAVSFARRVPLLEWLAVELSRLGHVSFAVAVPVVIVVAALLAAAGAVLRVWGAAYLGARTVHNMGMQAEAVMASGPYRYVRNPLYLGLWCMVAAMAFLMPPTGALVAMTLLTVFQLRLILGEEAFLASHLGEPYLTYLRAVPRLVPRLRTCPPPAGNKPRWFVAVLSELTPIGVFVTMAVLSWSYDHVLMMKGILVGFGLSLVARAFIIGKKTGEAGEG